MFNFLSPSLLFVSILLDALKKVIFASVASLVAALSQFDFLPFAHGNHLNNELHENFFHLAHKTTPIEEGIGQKVSDGFLFLFTAQTESRSFLQSPLLPIILAFLVFYLLAIRPQAKRQRMLEWKKRNIMKGDSLITSGGVMGKAISFREEGKVVVVEIAKEVRVDILRAMVHDVLIDIDKKGNRVDGKTPPSVVPATEAKNAKNVKKAK